MNKAQLIRETVIQCSEAATGMIGMGFVDLETGDTSFINEDVCFPTASTSKIFTLAELLRQVDMGLLSLDTKYTLDGKYQCYGSGVLKNLRPGAEISLYDYAALMISLSDNTATDFIMSLIGYDSLKTNLIDYCGLSKTRVDLSAAELIALCGEFKPGQSLEEMLLQYTFGDFRHSDMYQCRAERNNQTTPGEITKFMKTVATGQWVNEDVCSNMISFMRMCADSTMLVKHLPPEIDIAHKTGELSHITNDVALISSPKGRYILSLFYNGTYADEAEYFETNARGYFGQKLLADIGLAVYKAYIK